jgi:hypothetical protein
MVITATGEAVMLVLLAEGLKEYGVEIVSCGTIYISSFMKTDRGIHTILRFSFRNLKGCNVGTIDGMDL